MSDGTHRLVFSMADAHQAFGSTNSADPKCSRFQRSNSLLWPPVDTEGAGCTAQFRFEFGRDYRFALNQTSDETGTLWSLTVTKDTDYFATEVGSIFIDHALSLKTCSKLEPRAESFLHCPSGASSQGRSAGSWRGPFVNGDEAKAPANADADCGLDSAEAYVPARVAAENGEGLVGRPNIFFERGQGVKNSCEKASLWTSTVASTDDASGLGSSFDWTGPTPIVCTAGFAVLLAVASMVVSSCRRSSRSADAATKANKAAPDLAEGKQQVGLLSEEVETDAESGEGSGGSEERLRWEGYGEGNNFVRRDDRDDRDDDNFVHVPSFGISSNAR